MRHPLYSKFIEALGFDWASVISLARQFSSLPNAFEATAFEKARVLPRWCGLSCVQQTQAGVSRGKGCSHPPVGTWWNPQVKAPDDVTLNMRFFSPSPSSPLHRLGRLGLRLSSACGVSQPPAEARNASGHSKGVIEPQNNVTCATFPSFDTWPYEPVAV